MNVLAVMPTAQIRGGAEQSLLQAVRHRPESTRWTVALLEDGPLADRLRDTGADVVVIAAGRLRQPHRLLGAVRRLRRLLRQRQIDVAIGWMTKAQLYLGPAAARTGIPSVWYQLSNPAPNFWMDRLASWLPTRAVITVSQQARDLQAKTGGMPAELVYPGAELDRFDPTRLPPPAEVRATLGLPGAGPLIGIVGRLQRWKGMHTLVAAMPEVLRDFPEANCVIVGGEHPLEPAYPDDLQRLVKELGVADHVIFAGAHPNVEEWMQAMDIVVHASHNEPFGIVIVEAMGLGKPVIATDSGGPREIIAGGEDGLLVPFGDAQALAVAVVRLLRDTSERERMGTAARMSSRRFGAVEYARNLDAVLERYSRVA